MEGSKRKPIQRRWKE